MIEGSRQLSCSAEAITVHSSVFLFDQLDCIQGLSRSWREVKVDIATVL